MVQFRQDLAAYEIYKQKAALLGCKDEFKVEKYAKSIVLMKAYPNPQGVYVIPPFVRGFGIAGERIFPENMKRIKLVYPYDRIASIAHLFSGCRNLEYVDLSCFNTRNVCYANSAFADCVNLKQIDFSNFNTSNVTNMTNMFYNCRSLTQLDLRIFNTTNVDRMSGMFYGCSNLMQVNLRSFNTSKVLDVHEMFKDCRSITQLDLSTFDTVSVVHMYEMFSGCENLEVLNLARFDCLPDTNYSSVRDVFKGCKNLKKVYVRNTVTMKNNARVLFGDTVEIIGV